MKLAIVSVGILLALLSGLLSAFLNGSVSLRMFLDIAGPLMQMLTTLLCGIYIVSKLGKEKP